MPLSRQEHAEDIVEFMFYFCLKRVLNFLLLRKVKILDDRYRIDKSRNAKIEAEELTKDLWS